MMKGILKLYVEDYEMTTYEQHLDFDEDQFFAAYLDYGEYEKYETDDENCIPRDYKTAVKWLTLAAEQGHAEAQAILS